MPTSSRLLDSRLSPWSGFSVSDLIAHSPGIVRQWSAGLAASGEEPRPEALTDQLAWVLEGVGQWIASEDDEFPDDLRSTFRDLAFAYRTQGCRLEDTLKDLESLEEVLVGDADSDESGTHQANRSLRRAMRTLWTDTIQLDGTLSQRRDRERIDAMERFEEILSHELGNRLGAARTGVDILHGAFDDLSSERRDDLLELVGDGIDAALKTVDDVGAFVQTQRWAEDTLQPFDQVVGGILKGLRPQARGVGVRLDAPKDLPDAPVDAGRVRLILSNLLVNGIRYHDPEKESPWVRLHAESRRGTLRVEVTDNGIGIPEDEREGIFRFRQRGANHNGTDGSGLGLTIAAEAVSQLQGRIEMESELGEGTRFVLVLPVKYAEDDPDETVSGSASS